MHPRRYRRILGGMGDRATGIDVSHWTRVRSFDEVIGAGISIFGSKTSEGNTVDDPEFIYHRDGARAQSFVMVVYYHLARPGPARDQAARFLELVGPLRPNERLCLDIERTSAVDIDYVEEFFASLPTDRRHLLYGSSGVWQRIGNPTWPRASEVDLWAPRYKSGDKEPDLPPPWSAWLIWQYTDGGATGDTYECPGIGRVDASRFNGDVDALRAYVASSGPPPTP